MSPNSIVLYELVSYTKHHVITNFFFLENTNYQKRFLVVTSVMHKLTDARVDGAYVLNVIVASARVWRMRTRTFQLYFN